MDFTKLIVIGIIVAFSVSMFLAIDFEWNIDTNQYLSVIQSFLSVIFFVIPINRVAPILNTLIALTIFKYSVAIIKTVWQVLPIG